MPDFPHRTRSNRPPDRQLAPPPVPRIRTMTLTPGEPVPCDDLCPSCHNPSMIAIPAYLMTDHGLHHIATHVSCLDCDTDLEEDHQ
ncbi:hypothetical protein ACQBAU_16240 [Propionibacteriaceae bacterium Y2011]